jgi:hypothetical protein
MHIVFLPALMVAFGIAKPEDGIEACKKANDEGCIDLLKGFSFNAESLINEFKGLANWLDGKSLVRLIAPVNLMAQLSPNALRIG